MRAPTAAARGLFRPCAIRSGVADTGEDEEITLDTVRIRGAALYTVEHEQLAPETVVYFATDGYEARIPAQSLAQAQALADVATLVELEFFGSSGWLSVARRAVLRLVRWLNSRDVRTREF